MNFILKQNMKVITKINYECCVITNIIKKNLNNIPLQNAVPK